MFELWTNAALVATGVVLVGFLGVALHSQLRASSAEQSRLKEAAQRARSLHDESKVLLEDSKALLEPVKPETGIGVKADHLKALLRTTSDLMNEIEQDIEAAQARADEIQETIDHNSDLASLTEAQAEAVRLAMGSTVNDVVNEVVNEVVSESDRRTFWQQLIVQLVLGAMFFAVGVVATLIIS